MMTSFLKGLLATGIAIGALLPVQAWAQEIGPDGQERTPSNREIRAQIRAERPDRPEPPRRQERVERQERAGAPRPDFNRPDFNRPDFNRPAPDRRDDRPAFQPRVDAGAQVRVDRAPGNDDRRGGFDGRRDDDVSVGTGTRGGFVVDRARGDDRYARGRIDANGNRPGSRRDDRARFDGNRRDWNDRRDDDRRWDGNDRGRNGAWDRNDDRGRNDGWRGRDGGWDQNRNGTWNRGWRDDGRYDWNRNRQVNRGAYRLPRYYAPYGWNGGYRRFSVGLRLSSSLFGQNYWIDEPADYRLPPVWGPYRWVRYYDDALLVDLRYGTVVDVVYGIFW